MENPFPTVEGLRQYAEHEERSCERALGLRPSNSVKGDGTHTEMLYLLLFGEGATFGRGGTSGFLPMSACRFDVERRY